MRVGVYVDGFNLYYGGRGICGRGVAGWRWLNLRALAGSLLSERSDWVNAAVTRVAYCTALISGEENPSGADDQRRYIKALQSVGSIDLVEYGHYVNRVKRAPLAVAGQNGKPILTTSAWPVMVQDAGGAPVADARFMVSHAYREEKGSDVNVASHLLVDVLTGAVDGVIVISNDSDLAYPISVARARVPVGLVNPSRSPLAGKLRGQPGDGVGRHWWRPLTASDFVGHQLPDPAGKFRRPPGW